MEKLTRILIFFTILATHHAVHTAEVFTCELPLRLLCSSTADAVKCGKLQKCTFYQEQKMKLGREPICKDCTKFTNDMGYYMTHDTVFLAKVTDFMKAYYCKYFFTRLESVCDAIVDNYGPDLVQVYVDIVINKFCYFIMACDTANQNSQPTPIKLTELLLWKPLNGPVKKEPLCTDCLVFVKDMRTLLSDTSFQAEVIEYISEVCEDNLKPYPKIYLDLCINVTKQYIGALMNFTALPPWDDICEKYFCEISDKALFNNSPIQSINQEETVDQLEKDIQCIICENIVQQFNKLTSSGFTKDDIVMQPEILCALVSKRVTEKCINFINGNKAKILSIIENGGEAMLTCSTIGACSISKTSEERALTPSVDFKNQSSSLDPKLLQIYNLPGFSPTCAECQKVLGIVISMIKNDKTKKEILEILETICTKLSFSTKIQKECENTLEKYGELVINIILSSIDSKTICTAIHLCDQNMSEDINKISEHPRRLLKAVISLIDLSDQHM